MAGSRIRHPGTLEVVYDSGLPEDSLVAQIVQSNLKAIGIDVKLTGLETGAFLDRAFGAEGRHGAVVVRRDLARRGRPVGWILGTSWLFTGSDDQDAPQQYRRDSAAQIHSGEAEDHHPGPGSDASETRTGDPLADYQVLQGVSDKVHGFASAPWGLYYWDPIWLSG